MFTLNLMNLRAISAKWFDDFWKGFWSQNHLCMRSHPGNRPTIDVYPTNHVHTRSDESRYHSCWGIVVFTQMAKNPHAWHFIKYRESRPLETTSTHNTNQPRATCDSKVQQKRFAWFQRKIFFIPKLLIHDRGVLLTNTIGHIHTTWVRPIFIANE